MFIDSQDKSSIKLYEDYLKVTGALSNLYSDSDIPYLYYRIAEKIFCKAFNAEDLSRSDVSADAKKNNIGIGLKTFLIKNSLSFQKVAEFNAQRKNYANLTGIKLIKKIAELRNARLTFTQNVHELESSLYHCVVREKGKFKIYEEEMSLIDLNNIKISKNTDSSIVFNDGKNDYSFLISKSTLQKRFTTNNFKAEFEIEILKDPLLELYNFVNSNKLPILNNRIYTKTIFLPLYGRNRIVYNDSGLSQWHASGRARKSDEVYIPVPILIHQKIPDFFPERGKEFSLTLPNKKILSAKICQENGKALMSSPNTDLGKWILRDILNLQPGVLVSINDLDRIGIDSVRIDKVDDSNFEINFAKTNSYLEFENEIKSN
jgi:hypothetical protein